VIRRGQDIAASRVTAGYISTAKRSDRMSYWAAAHPQNDIFSALIALLESWVRLLITAERSVDGVTKM
jgi:hypothetical protein